MIQSASTPDAARYEHKYLVRPSRAAALRDYLSAFLNRDPYARARPYDVYSLYLDSPDSALWWATEEGRRDRFKLRVRQYSPDAGSVHLEAKHRHHRIVRKERMEFRSEYLDALDPAGLVRQSDEEALARFRALCNRISARPSCWVYYQRDAFTDGEDTRVSFDTELRTAWADGYTAPASAPCRWQPVPVHGEVVEIKCAAGVPMPVARAIERFELHRISFSKYALAMRALRGRFALHGAAV